MSNLPHSEDFGINSRSSDGKRIYPIWYQDLLLGAWGEGFVEKRPNAALIFVKRHRNYLIVTFDNLSNVRDRSPGREPWACKFARDQDICHLGVTINSPNWFRDPWLIEKFQTLAAEGFFEGYQKVLFTGTSMGAFAALSFGKLVPAAEIAAFNPQSTLDTEIVPWETRFQAGRRQDWTLPLSDTAEGIETHSKVSLFYDPKFELDARHAERLQAPNVTNFMCRMSGHKSALFLNRMGRLPDLMRILMFEDLKPLHFYRMYRDRRRMPWFKNTLNSYYNAKGNVAIQERIDQLFHQNRLTPSAVDHNPNAGEET